MLRTWGTVASSGGWDRTSGPFLFREVLYRLSYTGISQRRRQESNLLQSRVAADRLAVRPRRQTSDSIPVRSRTSPATFARLHASATPQGQLSVAQVGVEPTASLGLSKGGLPIAYRAKTFHSSSGGWSRTNIRGFRARCPTS